MQSLKQPCARLLQGPPEKPLLCNACGARFLVKHSLEGYVPNAKPCAAKRDCSAPKPKKEAGLRALAAQGRPAREKRKRTLSNRCGPAACMPGVCGMAEREVWQNQATPTLMAHLPRHDRPWWVAHSTNEAGQPLIGARR